MILYENGVAEIWDFEKFKRARLFTLEDKINDAFFSHDNKFVFIATQDKKMTIFEIISGNKINEIILQ